MAIIRSAKYNVNVPLLTEDPFPSSVNFYIQNDAYNKYTLDHYFDKTISWNVLGNTYSTFGGGAYQFDSFISGALLLKGEVTHVKHRIFNTNNDYRNNLDQSPFASMDPARPINNSRYDTDGTNNQSLFIYNVNTTDMGTTGLITYARRVNTTADNSNGFPLQNTTFTAAYSGFPVYRNPTTNNLIFVTNNHGTNYQPGATQGSTITNIFSAGTPTFSQVGATSGSNTNQFLGLSSDGYAMFLNNNIGNDYTQNIYKYNDSNNTATNPGTFTAIPAAAGNSAGGARTSPTGGTFQPKFSSRTFTDPNSGQTGWYTPYFDTNGAYRPHYFQWNRTADTFQRFSNITCNFGATSQNAVWYPDTTSASSVNVNYGMQRIVFNESFTSGGTRYLMMMQLHGAGGVWDANTTQRTMMTYTVSNTDYTQLTFHSNVVIPATPKNIVWLNDARTSLGIITHNFFYVYSFSSNAWSQTASLNYQFNAVGRDSLGRVWAVDNGPLNAGRLHLLSGSVPTSISVVPAANSYNYSGNTISTTYSVDAYDYLGLRTVANVTLTVNGASVRFVNQSNVQVSTITVTTSASATTTVNAAIVSAGTSSITTTVTI